MIPMFFFVLVRVFLRFGRENVFSVAILEISGEKKIMSIFSVSAFASSNFAAATLAESVSKTSRCPASELHPWPMRSEEKHIRLQPISCCTNALLHLIFMVRNFEKHPKHIPSFTVIVKHYGFCFVTGCFRPNLQSSSHYFLFWNFWILSMILPIIWSVAPRSRRDAFVVYISELSVSYPTFSLSSLV